MKAASPKECFDAQARVTVGLDEALKAILTKRAVGSVAPVYKMLLYFMGFFKVDFAEEAPGVGGKRFRPGLCLFIADAYGAREKAMGAAIAIELFHNFTLIHDDVEDRDEMRRNRPTLWKVWGINHAINAGDIQALLVSEMCLSAGPELGMKLLRYFAEVFEGQYLEFEMQDKPVGDALMTEDNALLVAAKKTGALIAAATECAGIACKQSTAELELLRKYGMNLGMIFQLADDYRSIWETEKETGKDAQSDIREHKRTVPFFAAYKELQGGAKKRLEELYSLSCQLTEKEITEALSIVNTTGAREYVLIKIKKYANEARSYAKQLSISDENKSILVGIVEMLALFA
jgi:geranylgeranyl pyrophosphate synthase